MCHLVIRFIFFFLYIGTDQKEHNERYSDDQNKNCNYRKYHDDRPDVVVWRYEKKNIN